MLKNRVYRACAAATPCAAQTSPSHQVRFLFSRLQELVPTNDDCYLSACNGSFCIIDRYRPAVAGSRVLIEIAGRYEWALVRHNPGDIITDAGTLIEGDKLNEANIIGVVIHEIIPAHRHPAAKN